MQTTSNNHQANDWTQDPSMYSWASPGSQTSSAHPGAGGAPARESADDIQPAGKKPSRTAHRPDGARPRGTADQRIGPSHRGAGRGRGASHPDVWAALRSQRPPGTRSAATGGQPSESPSPVGRRPPGQHGQLAGTEVRPEPPRQQPCPASARGPAARMAASRPPGELRVDHAPGQRVRGEAPGVDRYH